MKDFEGSSVYQADGQFHATVAASKGGAESRSAGPCNLEILMVSGAGRVRMLPQSVARLARRHGLGAGGAFGATRTAHKALSKMDLVRGSRVVQ